MHYKLTFDVTDTDDWTNRVMSKSIELKYDRAVQVGTTLAKKLSQSKNESHLEFVLVDVDVGDAT